MGSGNLLVREPLCYARGRLQKKQPTLTGELLFLVDVNGLEPLTLRTSSECSTS